VNGSGGGVYFYSDSHGQIMNNTLSQNSANSGGGIACRINSAVEIKNSILWGNTAKNQGPEILLASQVNPSTCSISSSDLQGGQASVYVYNNCTLNWGAGMIDSDPLFVDPAQTVLHLTYPSPCRDSGDAGASKLPEEDMEGDPRIAHGTVDMGADEFFTHLYYTGDGLPGENVHIKFIGLPDTSPVALCLGTGVLDQPIDTLWGTWWNQWWLQFPIVGPIDFGSIPSPDGVLVLEAMIPPDIPGPYSIPMQSFIGNSLTNLCVLEVE
jgi:hypothetical protein